MAMFSGISGAAMPNLVKRVRMPVPVAAATSTVVVAGTVLGAAITHLVELARVGGFDAIPWDLIVWAAPGSMLGAQLGSRLQGRFNEFATRRFFGILFGVIGVVFLVAFTVFRRRFAS